MKNNERGIVLLILLWTLALLSLLALNLASSVQTETTMARTTLDSEQAYFFTRGALEETLFWLSFPNRDEEKQKARFPYRSGMNHCWVRKGEFYSHIAILDEAGKLDLNFCDPQMLQRLLEILGNEETLSANLSESIAEWRKPDASAKRAEADESSALGPDAQYIKHRPFGSVEELLLVPGMTREILYGSSIREGNGEWAESGQHGVIKGLVDYVTVFVGKGQINPNYAEPEILASLPGLDMEEASAIVSARQEEPFKSAIDIGERTALLLQNDVLSKLTTQPSKVYSLIASGGRKNSRVRRSLRVVVKLASGANDKMERLMWQDEFWASPNLLAWLALGNEPMPGK
jgi:general secretion pathway protein K